MFAEASLFACAVVSVGVVTTSSTDARIIDNVGAPGSPRPRAGIEMPISIGSPSRSMATSCSASRSSAVESQKGALGPARLRRARGPPSGRQSRSGGARRRAARCPPSGCRGSALTSFATTPSPRSRGNRDGVTVTQKHIRRTFPRPHGGDRRRALLVHRPLPGPPRGSRAGHRGRRPGGPRRRLPCAAAVRSQPGHGAVVAHGHRDPPGAELHFPAGPPPPRAPPAVRRSRGAA